MDLLSKWVSRLSQFCPKELYKYVEETEELPPVDLMMGLFGSTFPCVASPFVFELSLEGTIDEYTIFNFSILHDYFRHKEFENIAISYMTMFHVHATLCGIEYRIWCQGTDDVEYLKAMMVLFRGRIHYLMSNELPEGVLDMSSMVDLYEKGIHEDKFVVNYKGVADFAELVGWIEKGLFLLEYGKKITQRQNNQVNLYNLEDMGSSYVEKMTLQFKCNVSSPPSLKDRFKRWIGHHSSAEEIFTWAGYEHINPKQSDIDDYLTIGCVNPPRNLGPWWVCGNVLYSYQMDALCARELLENSD